MIVCASALDAVMVLSDLCCSVLADEKLVLQKSVSDLHSSLRDMETSRLEAERHRQELELNLKSVETERSLLTASISDLQTTLTKADDKQEQLRKENFALKQKVHLLALNCLFLLKILTVNLEINCTGYHNYADLWKMLTRLIRFTHQRHDDR